MGCGSLQKQKPQVVVPSESVNGLLKVTIEQADIYKSPSILFQMDPYLRLQMSNQEYRGFIHKKSGRRDLFNESFEFIINSCYKSAGRSVTIQVWDKHAFGDKMIGLGTIDIDPIINFDQKNMMGSRVVNVGKVVRNNEMENQQRQFRTNQCKLKVFLTQGLQEIGYLHTFFEFIEQPVVIVGFKFSYASLRRTSSIFTTMNIRIQVIAGEEILCTQSKKDKDTKNPPTWEQEILYFNIPKSLMQCIIRVLDDDKQVGRMKFYFRQIITKKGEHQFTQQLESERSICGVIKFFVLVGLSYGINQSRRQMKALNNRSELKAETQPSTQMKRQFPQQKETKFYESEPKTTSNTLGNQQEISRTQKLQTSIVVNEQQQMRR